MKLRISLGTVRRVAWVALGGAAGSLARAAWTAAWAVQDYGWATWSVNLLGSFALGWLLASRFARGRLGPDVRAFFGTGLIGGFTTFSAVEVNILQADHHSPELALLVGVASLVSGLAAVNVGERVASRGRAPARFSDESHVSMQ